MVTPSLQVKWCDEAITHDGEDVLAGVALALPSRAELRCEALEAGIAPSLLRLASDGDAEGSLHKGELVTVTLGQTVREGTGGIFVPDYLIPDPQSHQCANIRGSQHPEIIASRFIRPLEHARTACWVIRAELLPMQLMRTFGDNWNRPHE
ncbi:hypothetical protein GCM10009679_20290 [Saccharothrix algeriensis]|uniref:Uncharacterized protein n=1 Tax=Catellatospora bangladeshensis TaxID=310355 RepID=A0A8J3JNR8_9ACTN|nr:hypothetical protein Cba03nite_34470 [Catellatospora bangladeshensis]